MSVSMSTAIFSSALSGIKSNPEASAKQTSMTNKSSRRASGGDNSVQKKDIFSRLKQTEKKRTPLSLNARLNRGHDKVYDVTKIHNKTISKDITSRLGRRAERGDADDEVWKHDLYKDGPARVENTAASTIFIRNLPDDVDSSTLKSLLKDTTSVVGQSIERGTAEVTFSSKVAAQKAINNLSGRNYMGRTIKAALVSELNAGMMKVREKSRDDDTPAPASRKRDRYSSKMTMDTMTPSTGKGSILNRIKRKF